MHARAVSAAGAARLARRAAERPAHAEHVRGRAVSLREALYALFAPGSGPAARQDAVAVLNEELQRAWLHSRVVVDDEGARLEPEADEELDRPLWTVAQSALDLLLSPSRGRIKACEGADCGWLFVDTSKAGRRRWCSMESCGNRVKVQRYRARSAP